MKKKSVWLIVLLAEGIHDLIYICSKITMG